MKKHILKNGPLVTKERSFSTWTNSTGFYKVSKLGGTFSLLKSWLLIHYDQLRIFSLFTEVITQRRISLKGNSWKFWSDTCTNVWFPDDWDSIYFRVSPRSNSKASFFSFFSVIFRLIKSKFSFEWKQVTEALQVVIVVSMKDLIIKGQ